jgi:hypothetical protein
VLAAIAEDRWPTAELQALIGYLHAEGLRQAADEEWLLFPAHDAPPGFTRLSRDHVRADIDVLARSAADRGTCPRRNSPPPPATSSHSSRAISPPKRRCWQPPDDVPATATLACQPHQWYPLTDP